MKETVATGWRDALHKLQAQIEQDKSQDNSRDKTPVAQEPAPVTA